MALRFCDSADHYTTILEKWTTQSGFAVSAGNGRFSDASLRCDEFGNDQVTKVLDAQATWIVGMAFRCSMLPTADSTLISLFDGTTTQCDVRLQSNGKLKVTRAGTQLGSQGSATIAVNIWYFIEFKVTINDSTGIAVVRVQGVTDIDLSSQDTKNTTNASADRVRFMGSGTSAFGNIDLSDITVCDGTGSSPTNDFLGDVRVESRLPNGNGNSSQWVGSDGNSTDNYLLVDEAAPNGDTDYVQGSTVGDKDTYTFQDLTPTSGTVFGVQILPYAKKTDAGSRSIKTVARLSATETDGPDQALSTTYQYLSDIRETKPGGGAWTISDVNSAEFGVKVSV